MTKATTLIAAALLIAAGACTQTEEPSLDAEAQFQLGEGREQDLEQAMHWYREAAEQGHADAMANLGGAYHYGAGVQQDPKEAYIWYSLSRAGGIEDEQIYEHLVTLQAQMTPAQVQETQDLAIQRANEIDVRKGQDQ